MATLLLKLLPLLLVAFLTPLCRGQKFDFNCLTNINLCGSGSCDLNSGDCNCPDSAVNPTYKCETFTEGTNCQCENEARCDDGGTCYCKESNYGTTCKMERAQVNCEGTRMFVNINPEGAFAGKMFVFGYDTDECQLTSNAPASLPDFIENKDDLDGYSILIDHTSTDCGNAEESSVTENGTEYTTQERTFLVQYNPQYRTAVDKMIKAKCKISKNGTIAYTSSQSITETDVNYDNVDINDEVEAVTVKVLKEDDTAIDGAVLLGAKLKMVFTLSPGSGVPDFNIDYCDANNTEESGENFKEVRFLEKGCPATNAVTLFYGAITKPEVAEGEAKKIIIYLRAFLFTGNSTQVGFGCKLDFCDTAPCSTATCPGLSDSSSTDSSNSSDSSNPGTNGTDSTTNENNSTDTNDTGSNNNNSTDTSNNDGSDNSTTTTPDNNDDKRRKKRAAGDASGQKVSTTVTVLDPLNDGALADLVDKVKEEEQECIEQPNVMALVAILSVSVILLLILTIILVIRMMRSRHKVVAAPASDRFQPVQSVRMPRLELATSSAGSTVGYPNA